ncbi:MAG: deoxyribodipyrimidine photo-lyase, partial [Erythrobacter sp.]|nr:deoxyribodipyrimidine photo-lyase [Erythrobacter sp.]
FDAAGYIRLWVPELAGLDEPFVHDPPDHMRGAYPAKIIGHGAARERALGRYRAMKG